MLKSIVNTFHGVSFPCVYRSCIHALFSSPARRPRFATKGYVEILRSQSWASSIITKKADITSCYLCSQVLQHTFLQVALPRAITTMPVTRCMVIGSSLSDTHRETLTIVLPTRIVTRMLSQKQLSLYGHAPMKLLPAAQLQAEEPPAEPPQPEEPKAEEQKAEEAKTEEAPKTEEPKIEEPKAEEPQAEEANAEEPKAEEAKAEEPPKAEEAKAEEPKAEEPMAL